MDVKYRFACMYTEEERISFLKWWVLLKGDSNDKRKGKKGVCAELRRYDSPDKAATHKEIYVLKKYLPTRPIEAIAAICGLVANIKKGSETVNNGFAKNLAKSMSELRFKQLMSSEDMSELYTHMRRAIKMLDNRTNPVIIADIILAWYYYFSYGNKKNSIKFTLSEEYYTELMK